MGMNINFLLNIFKRPWHYSPSPQHATGPKARVFHKQNRSAVILLSACRQLNQSTGKQPSLEFTPTTRATLLLPVTLKSDPLPWPEHDAKYLNQRSFVRKLLSARTSARNEAPMGCGTAVWVGVGRGTPPKRRRVWGGDMPPPQFLNILKLNMASFWCILGANFIAVELHVLHA